MAEQQKDIAAQQEAPVGQLRGGFEEEAFDAGFAVRQAVGEEVEVAGEPLLGRHRVVRAGGRFLVLDNGTDRIVDSADVADYKPMLTFAANGKSYTHGYRRDVPPVIYASAPVVLAETTVEPAFGAELSVVYRIVRLSNGFLIHNVSVSVNAFKDRKPDRSGSR